MSRVFHPRRSLVFAIGRSRFFTTPGRAFFTASASEQQAYVACVRFRKLAHARGEKPGMRPVVKKNACGIWVKNVLRA